ncbi:MAG: NAD(P)H-binding protein [Candidatus Dormiibacterota bacterium]
MYIHYVLNYVDPPQLVLVTGVTGRHGGTGATVVRLLRERDIAVRVLVRRPEAVPTEGDLEVALGDLHDRRSLLEALKGVDAAYFTDPVDTGIVDAAANFAAAGRETHLQHLVVMSMLPASPGSPSDLGRSQWLAEEIFRWADLSAITLRIAAFFFENLELLHGREIREEGLIRNSFGDVAVSWMSAADAARLAVAALTEPQRFRESCVYPTGTSVASYRDIAALVAQQAGRPVRHETITEAAWRERLVELSDQDPRINPAMAQHIAALGAAVRADHSPNSVYLDLVGEAPESISDAIASGRLHLA